MSACNEYSLFQNGADLWGIDVCILKQVLLLGQNNKQQDSFNGGNK